LHWWTTQRGQGHLHDYSGPWSRDPGDLGELGREHEAGLIYSSALAKSSTDCWITVQRMSHVRPATGKEVGIFLKILSNGPPRPGDAAQEVAPGPEINPQSQ
jgi:hypothetical protein